MRRGREQAELVKACAAQYGVTPRGVRKWRDQQDSRWAKFLAERAAAGMVPVGAASAAAAPAVARQWSEEEIDLARQIRRLKEAAADLGERAELAKAAGDVDAEMQLRRMHVQHVEALRRLEKDAPGIQRESGDVIPRRAAEQALVGYASAIKAALQLLPDRIFSLFPELAAEVKDAVLREVHEIQRAAATLKLSDAEPG
jgi:hypothetical protein